MGQALGDADETDCEQLAQISAKDRVVNDERQPLLEVFSWPFENQANSTTNSATPIVHFIIALPGNRQPQCGRCPYQARFEHRGVPI